MQHVRDLLANLRFLEAAGACGAMARTVTEDDASEPPEWWEALGMCARTYRSAILSASAQGFSAIDEWSQSESSANHDDLVRERARLGAEHRRWLCEIPGGQAYVAWLSAYVAVAEIDGERAVSGLERCSAIVREFVEVPGSAASCRSTTSSRAPRTHCRHFCPCPSIRSAMYGGSL